MSSALLLISQDTDKDIETAVERAWHKVFWPAQQRYGHILFLVFLAKISAPQLNLFALPAVLHEGLWRSVLVRVNFRLDGSSKGKRVKTLDTARTWHR
ncbi:hypothetical protein A0H81_09734 [Grifola frondosa]|uniref:Uncharacterized protein n=1 Tax=Grifola frondosa TaxID=5627 RepID=A0A1C7M1E4_GRIFR|nr:hypothetical protein A0H81_09734 [Grifola frondosa]